MKRIIIIAAAAALMLASLAACTSNSDGDSEETTVAVTQPPTKSADETGEYVLTAKEERISYTDKSGNSFNTTYRIPQLAYYSEDALALNDEIVKQFAEDFKNAEKEQKDKLTLTCDSLNYEFFKNDNIISIVVKRTYYTHLVDYSVYNFDGKAEKKLDNEGLCAALGLDAAQTNESLKKAIANDFDSRYRVEGLMDGYEDNYAKTVSDENVAASSMYLDKDGKLTAICKEYASVGSGEFSVIIKIG